MILSGSCRGELDMAPSDREGGVGKTYQLFRARMDPLSEELNEGLAA